MSKKSACVYQPVCVRRAAQFPRRHYAVRYGVRWYGSNAMLRYEDIIIRIRITSYNVVHEKYKK